MLLSHKLLGYLKMKNTWLENMVYFQLFCLVLNAVGLAISLGICIFHPAYFVTFLRKPQLEPLIYAWPIYVFVAFWNVLRVIRHSWTEEDKTNMSAYRQSKHANRNEALRLMFGIPLLGLFAAINEESLFRFHLVFHIFSPILRFFMLSNSALVGAFILSNILFTLAHFDPSKTFKRLPFPCMFGFVMSYCTMKYGIFAAIFIHGITDVVAFETDKVVALLLCWRCPPQPLTSLNQQT